MHGGGRDCSMSQWSSSAAGRDGARIYVDVQSIQRSGWQRRHEIGNHGWRWATESAAAAGRGQRGGLGESAGGSACGRRRRVLAWWTWGTGRWRAAGRFQDTGGRWLACVRSGGKLSRDEPCVAYMPRAEVFFCMQQRFLGARQYWTSAGATI
jgi:hypothetical protein